MLAEKRNAQLLEEMGIPFGGPSEDAEGNSQDRLLRTSDVQLIWAISGDRSSTYVVMPCPFPSECETIEFDKKLVSGVINLFLESE